MTEEKTETKKKARYELVEVPTQTAIVVRDNDSEEYLSPEQASQEILNKLDKIVKSVC